MRCELLYFSFFPTRTSRNITRLLILPSVTMQKFPLPSNGDQSFEAPLSFTKHPLLMRPLPQKCIPYSFSQHANKRVKVQLILVKKRTCSLKQTTLQAPLLDNVLFRNDTPLGVSQVQIRRKPFLHQYIMFHLT